MRSIIVSSSDVPPPLELSEPEIIVYAPDRNQANYYTWAGLAVIQWRVMTPVNAELMNAYRARFAFVDPDPLVEREPYFDLVLPLSDIPLVTEEMSFEHVYGNAQRRGMYRVSATESQPVLLRGWCRDARVGAEFLIALEDPNGQIVEKTFLIE